MLYKWSSPSSYTFVFIVSAQKSTNYCAMAAGIFPEVSFLAHTFAIVVSALAMGAEGGESWVRHAWADLAGLTPGVGESLDHETAAARGLGHHHGQRVQTPPVLNVRVAQAPTQI